VLFPREVGRHEDALTPGGADLLFHLAPRSLGATGDDDARAFSREAQRGGAADPARRSRDDRDLAFETRSERHTRCHRGSMAQLPRWRSPVGPGTTGIATASEVTATSSGWGPASSPAPPTTTRAASGPTRRSAPRTATAWCGASPPSRRLPPRSRRAR